MTKIFRSIIVEDEEPARERLKQLLSEFQEIELIAEAKNGIEAVEIIDTLKPDLLFLDIMMPGLNAFEVLNKIKQSPYVIFCSAYEEYALQAFKEKSIDYLVKPINKTKLDKSIKKLNSLTSFSQRDKLLDTVQEMLSHQQPVKLTSLPVKKSDKVIFLKLSAITYFNASEKYVEINTNTGEKHITNQSLRHLEEKLPQNFIRIHRSYIINVEKIKEVRKHFAGKYNFILNDIHATSIISARSYNQLVKSMFDL